MALKYMDYKLNSIVMNKYTEEVCIITKRNHKEKTVSLTSVSPAKYYQIEGLIMNYGSNWRTYQELNRNFILMDKKAAWILYGIKT